MKALTTAIVAAALVVPGMAAAQRHTTPGAEQRIEKALEKAEQEEPIAKTAQRDERREQADDRRVPAAKAGKVNAVAPTVGTTN